MHIKEFLRKIFSKKIVFSEPIWKWSSDYSCSFFNIWLSFWDILVFILSGASAHPNPPNGVSRRAPLLNEWVLAPLHIQPNSHSSLPSANVRSRGCALTRFSGFWTIRSARPCTFCYIDIHRYTFIVEYLKI